MNEDLTKVLDAIEGLRSDVREDQEQIWRKVDKTTDCANKTKLKVAKLKGEHDVLDNEVKHIVKSTDKMDEHVGNEEVHFDKEKAKTTTVGYLAKKKILLILLTALGVLVSAATGMVVAWMQNGGV